MSTSRRSAAAGASVTPSHDAFDLERAVALGVEGHVAHAPALAEVDAAGELAHDHDVDPADDLGLDVLATSGVEDFTGRRLA